jgi:hypothetical protein
MKSSTLASPFGPRVFVAFEAAAGLAEKYPATAAPAVVVSFVRKLRLCSLKIFPAGSSTNGLPSRRLQHLPRCDDDITRCNLPIN